MSKKEIEPVYLATKQAWREWLAENHETADFIWLLYYKKHTNRPSITWSDAVDEALCFGWIDSTRKTLDEERYIQYFCKRKAKSNWSKINKDKIAILMEAGLMSEAGLKSVEIAKANGSWTILDSVEALIVPDDLTLALQKEPGAEDFFLSLSNSAKKMMLYKLVQAKRAETRQKRIVEIVQQLQRNRRNER